MAVFERTSIRPEVGFESLANDEGRTMSMLDRRVDDSVMRVTCKQKFNVNKQIILRIKKARYQNNGQNHIIC